MQTTIKKIESRIAVCPRTDCWVWQGEINRNGYGRVWVEGKRLMSHRVSYELFVGPIPEGMLIDHLCRNRAGCNPNHLEAVTHAENTRRGEAVLFKKETKDEKLS